MVAPSPIPFNEGEPPPIALDKVGINAAVAAFEAAARRALSAGFNLLEIHAAHTGPEIPSRLECAPLASCRQTKRR